MATLLLINGPNLNLLGSREPAVYGSTQLAEIEDRLRSLASKSGHTLEAFQSNAEHEIVDRIQQAAANIDFILFNPGAFTHTSISIRNALLAVQIPFIDVSGSARWRRNPATHSKRFKAMHSTRSSIEFSRQPLTSISFCLIRAQV